MNRIRLTRTAAVLLSAITVVVGAVGCMAGAVGDDATLEVIELRLGPSGFVDLPIPFASLQSLGPSAFDVTRALDRAREDDNIRGVLVRSGGSLFSRAARQEIATELHRVREAGKQVIFFDEAFSNRDYTLATHSDRILTIPTGTIELLGMAAGVTFYKDLLNTIGVEVDYVRAGSYKSAVEPYTRTQMSPEFERSMNRLLDDLYDQMVQAIADGRGLEPGRVRALIDGGPYTASEALANGLVDRLVYEDELDAALDALCKEDVRLVSQRDSDDGGDSGGISRLFRLWKSAVGARDRSRSPRDKIALIHVAGLIVSGSSSDPFRGGDFVTGGAVADALRTAAADDTVKAIVLRVDSGGGSALASDVIWRAVVQARDAKPVIASMGGVAASGGYYSAMAAHHILADAGTITGSIGVFGAKFNMGGLYDKLGVHKQIITRGKNATLYDQAHGFTPSERARVEALIASIYDDFLTKAAEGRGMPKDKIKELAQGQVWTGREALENGLIDEIGGLKRAFEVAKERAGYSTDTKFELLELPESPSLLDMLLRDGWSALRTREQIGLLPLDWAFALTSLSRDHAFAALPFVVETR